MEKIDNGGPAFPIPGMSLRDYFAAKAMQALLTGLWARGTYDGWSHAEITREAYSIADSILKVRQAE